jgi:hypothetical protein
LNASSGVNHRQKGEIWGRQQVEAYSRKNYHQPSDEYTSTWDRRITRPGIFINSF